MQSSELDVESGKQKEATTNTQNAVSRLPSSQVFKTFSFRVAIQVFNVAEG